MLRRFVSLGWRKSSCAVRVDGRLSTEGNDFHDVLEPRRLGNTKIAADLSCKMVVDFRVPWNRATPTGDCVMPP